MFSSEIKEFRDHYEAATYVGCESVELFVFMRIERSSAISWTSNFISINGVTFNSLSRNTSLFKKDRYER